MANISAADVNKLRKMTGSGMMDCKKALVEADGDFDKAIEILRKKGQKVAAKRGDREATEGLIIAKANDAGTRGVITQLSCETDFVAKNEKFEELVKDVAMHVAASAPIYVSQDDIPTDVKDAKTKEFSEKAESEGKPADMIEKIVGGQVSKYFAEQCLLDQPFIKNPDITVGDLVKEANAQLGENIVVRRFSRMQLGEIS